MVGPARAGEGGRVDNDALVAALGRDAASAVACYREQVVAEAARQLRDAARGAGVEVRVGELPPLPSVA